MINYPIITLLPWLMLDEEIIVGGVRYVPWSRRERHSRVPYISQGCVRNIMAVYKDINGRMIDKAVLAYHIGQNERGEMSAEQLKEILYASQILAFSAIAEKEYFGQVAQNKHVNSSYFRTIFQRFQEPCEDVSYPIRLLDGHLLNIQNRRDLKISKPLQCMVKPSDINRFKFNHGLKNALHSAIRKRDTRCQRLREAIRQYMMATTCEDWAAKEQEYISLVSAYEGLFDKIDGEKAKAIASETSKLLTTYGSIRLNDSKRLEWKAVSQRDQSRWLHYEWMRECYVLRNKYSHGKGIGGMKLSWTEEEHYILGCWLFPLVVKAILYKVGLYQLMENDEVLLFSINKLLDVDRWEGAYKRKGKRTNMTNWQQIISETRGMLAKQRAIRAYSS